MGKCTRQPLEWFFHCQISRYVLFWSRGKVGKSSWRLPSHFLMCCFFKCIAGASAMRAAYATNAHRTIKPVHMANEPKRCITDCNIRFLSSTGPSLLLSRIWSSLYMVYGRKCASHSSTREVIQVIGSRMLIPYPVAWYRICPARTRPASQNGLGT